MLGRAIAATGASCLVLASGSANAATSASFVRWSMNETSGNAMLPDGGQGPSGAIGTHVAVGVTTDTSRGYGFPYGAPENGVDDQRTVLVRDAASLNPGWRSVTVSVRIRTTGSGEYNVMQKGQARAYGGYYKIEVNGNGSHPGIAKCTFGQRARSVAVVSGRRVNDGQWHMVKCHKGTTATGEVYAEIAVDGVRTTRHTAISNFSISNTTPLSIGGKVNCDGTNVDCDYYEGTVDQASVSIG